MNSKINECESDDQGNYSSKLLNTQLNHKEESQLNVEINKFQDQDDNHESISEGSETDSKNESLNDMDSEKPIINVDIQESDKSFIVKKNMQEVLDESKLKTEQELIKLGQQIKEKEQKEMDLIKNSNKNKLIISKYKNHEIIKLVDNFIKNKKYIELKELLDAFFEYETFVNKIIIQKDEKIEKLDTQLDDSLQDNKDLMEENNNLEDKIEKYWEPRVLKLRNKLIERKTQLKYYHFGYILTIIHTFVLTKFGFYQYFNFWTSLFSIIYSFIYFIVFLLPNMYQLITNTSNYYLIYDFLLGKMNDLMIFAFNKSNSLINNINYLILKSNWTIGVLLFSLFVIKITNRMLRK